MKSKLAKLLLTSLFSFSLVPVGLLAQDSTPPTTPPPTPKQCRMECKDTEKAKLDTCLAAAKALPKGKHSGRKAAVKKCMVDFHTALKKCRKDCKKPCDPQQCLDACSSSQSAAVASCNSTFDPSTCTPDDAPCIADVTTHRDQCVADANSVFANCNSLCTCN